MATITYIITVELADESDYLTDDQNEKNIADIEDLLLRKQIGYALYDSDWFYDSL